MRASMYASVYGDGVCVYVWTHSCIFVLFVAYIYKYACIAITYYIYHKNIYLWTCLFCSYIYIYGCICVHTRE